MENIVIREERQGDDAAIRRVNVEAFGGPVEANVVDTLRKNGKVTLSLVAMSDKEVVGHILFSPVAVDSGEAVTTIQGLAPMAVLPALQNRGIGGQLVRCGLELLRGAGHAAVVVLGHPAYYPRFGFVPASRFAIRSEYEVPDEAFMALELIEGGLKGCAGTARYEPEFAGA